MILEFFTLILMELFDYLHQLLKSFWDIFDGNSETGYFNPFSRCHRYGIAICEIKIFYFINKKRLHLLFPIQDLLLDQFSFSFFSYNCIVKKNKTIFYLCLISFKKYSPPPYLKFSFSLLKNWKKKWKFFKTPNDFRKFRRCRIE